MSMLVNSAIHDHLSANRYRVAIAFNTRKPMYLKAWVRIQSLAALKTTFYSDSRLSSVDLSSPTILGLVFESQAQHLIFFEFIFELWCEKVQN